MKTMALAKIIYIDDRKLNMDDEIRVQSILCFGISGEIS